MQMLLKLGSPDKVADFVNAELDAGRKIFGLGHAVYDVDDPGPTSWHPCPRPWANVPATPAGTKCRP